MGAKTLAWLAHAYTALGLICAAAILWLVVEGGDASFRLAFFVMVIATVIDATDGRLARRVRVSDVLPGFDGRRLDDLIDFQTYTCLPLALLWRADALPGPWQPWLLVPLVASAYGFCQVHAKTDDHYFLGFPSYWNVVAFYIYVLRVPAAAALTFILVLSALTFAPTRYLHPSRGGRWAVPTVLFGSAWLASLLAILWLWGASPRWLVVGSLAFPAYYMVASWALSFRLWRGR